jgi:hypothetical protein
VYPPVSLVVCHISWKIFDGKVPYGFSMIFWLSKVKGKVHIVGRAKFWSKDRKKIPKVNISERTNIMHIITIVYI